MVQHVKSPTGLNIGLNVSRLWVRKHGSRPGFSKVEHLHLLEVGLEKLWGEQSTSGVMSLRWTFSTWHRMKERHILKTFASCLQVQFEHLSLIPWSKLINLPLQTASGDLRNVVKTVAQLPRSYQKSLEVTINDRDLDIVARNLILLLVGLVVENIEEAIHSIIHLWYSALVRESDIDILHNRIRPLIQDICEKIKKKPSKTLLGKTWTFGSRSLRLVLEQSSWNRLLTFFDKPAGLTAEQAQRIRTANTLAHSRRDYRDRYMSCLTPSQRISFIKFREDGLLLPFGSLRHDFREPNPCVNEANKGSKWY